MTVKDLKEFIFENYYYRIDFTEKDSCYSLEKKNLLLLGEKKIYYYLLQVNKKKYLILLKLENTMNYFLKLNNKIPKASKALENPQNGDKKFTTLRLPKTASNLLKSMMQTTEFLQKRISYYRTPRNYYQFIKVKNYYSATKQNKNSKAADCTVQFDIVKRHIHPKTCLQR